MRVLVSGAASGVGREVARVLARPGCVLFLTDVQADELAVTRALCEARGAEVQSFAADIRERARLAEWIGNAITLDHAFICAGITGGRPPYDDQGIALEREERVRAMLEINVDGVFNIFYPTIALMRRRAPDRRGLRGRVCVMSSVASFVSYPGTPSYCASKAAVDRFFVSTAPSLDALGITLTSVCCGFIKTGMVKGNRFPMPGLVPVDIAVARILRGVAQGKRRVIFPLWLAAGSRIVDMLPARWAERCYMRQPSAQAEGMPDF
ncbi:oxidoreductase [Neokomagataea thailandica NBRC 106555]|uniref:SDR family NAD(P)-dependent oxidoreductase n=2 Tax=Neokomagataea TaxID=1223423 RepID=A0A4Y6V498_9PROT|nr:MULTISPECIES: SDR family NAD(P)-dependent oxidoreductase [Neokomagataea]QDH24763.1 SDR family NAD(P)-dependent oxidoreductase [Neokomagataea tanensis]GBR53635.1 oxidoreductase [Neokomagataea thailandica NBRC 106555]